MSSRIPPDSSATLRTLIHAKRAHGKVADALILARLGSRIATQERIAGGRDEVSRMALARYLELMPEDEEVRQSLARLDSETPTKPSGRPRLRWLLWLMLVATGVATAGAIHLTSSPTLPEPPPLSTPDVVIPPSPPPATVEAPVVIRAVGDVVLGTDFPRNRLPGERELERIKELRKDFEHADIVIGNLEGVMTSHGKPRKDGDKDGQFSFRMPEGYATTLREMGFDVMSLANNHSLDFGKTGLESTVRALKEAGIQPVGVPGAGMAVAKVRNTSVAFLNYSYLPAFAHLDDKQRIGAEIRQARMSADLVVVSVHGGNEGPGAIGAPSGREYFMDEYRGDLSKFAHFAIDAGACAVFGHGPHVVRPFEVYKEKPIFFSLGNFVGFRTLSTKGKLANSLIAEVRLSPKGELLGAGVIPLKLDPTGIPRADYSADSMDALDGLLDERLEKQMVLGLDLRARAKPVQRELSR